MRKMSIAYVGSYTYGRSDGIYAIGLDPETGRIENLGRRAEIKTSPYFVLDRDRRFLYTLTEVNGNNDKSSGAVASFEMNRATAELRPTGMVKTNSRVPVHINSDRANKHLFLANFRDGLVSVMGINEDGSAGRMLDEVIHTGSGPHKTKQTQAHAHYVTLTPDEKFLCAADMGTDKIAVYGFNGEKGTLEAFQELTVGIKSGAGPRHMEFGPDGKYLYVLNQLASSITVLEYDGAGFEEKQYISSLPESFSGESSASAVHVSRDGKFLYASNRIHNSISCFRIDKRTGGLEFVSDTFTGGDIPRDFAIDPSGKFMLVGHQDSDTVLPFVIGNKTGKPERAGDGLRINNPVCIRFI